MPHRDILQQETMLPPNRGIVSDAALMAAKEATRQTVEELFGKLGVNVANFDSLQSLRDDLEFVHRLRTGSSKFGTTVLIGLAGGAAITIWEFIKAFFKIHFTWGGP